jgi:hypothetical protein
LLPALRGRLVLAVADLRDDRVELDVKAGELGVEAGDLAVEAGELRA